MIININLCHGNSYHFLPSQPTSTPNYPISPTSYDKMTGSTSTVSGFTSTGTGKTATVTGFASTGSVLSLTGTGGNPFKAVANTLASIATVTGYRSSPGPVQTLHLVGICAKNCG